MGWGWDEGSQDSWDVEDVEDERLRLVGWCRDLGA